MDQMNSIALDRYRIDNSEKLTAPVLNESLCKACMTAFGEFSDKAAFIYYEINERAGGAEVGRVYKVRKILTDQENGSFAVADDDRPFELYLWMDYYLQKTTKKKKTLLDGSDYNPNEILELMESVFPQEAYDKDPGRKAPIPRVGETLTLKNRNKSKMDGESAEIFQGVVLEVYPNTALRDNRTDRIIVKPSKNTGTLKVQIVTTAYRPHRSLSLPPLIGKYTRRGEFVT